MADEIIEGDIVERSQDRVFLTRDQILATQDIQTEVIYVPEWGSNIEIRGLTVGEVNHVVSLATHKGKMDMMQSALFTFIRGMVRPKFTDMDIDDLKKKSALVLRIVKDINRLSGMGETAVEDAEKN